MSTTSPRSLADDLRARTDAELAALLRDRPDLGVPLPGDLTALAARTASRASVQRAIDGLDAPALQVLEVLSALPEPTTAADVTRLWGAPAEPILDRLRALAMVWGPVGSKRRTTPGLYLVRAARDVIGPHPAGLGPPLAEALGRRSPLRLAELVEDLGLTPTGDPQTALDRLADHLGRRDVLDALLARAPHGVAAVLDRLTWGPPIGQVSQADRSVRATSANGPVEWLLAHGLLGVADAGHVVLPREVGLALRGGRVHREPGIEPPPLVVSQRSPRVVDNAAAGNAAEVVRLVEALGDLWGSAPPPLLRAGGIGVRELRRTAQGLEVDDAVAARVVELAYVAGLVADDGEADPRWAPTPAYDLWTAAEVGERWELLADAWLSTTRCPALVGSRDAKDTPRGALGPDLDRASAPATRQWVLRAVAGAGGSVDPAGLHALADWTAPRRASRLRTALIDWAMEEGAWLGVLGAGAVSQFGRALLDGQPDEAARLLEKHLPEPIDHVLLQADLTAVAPGPLERSLARELALMAEVESRGGATVYRFTAASVRRSLDAGRSAEDLLTLLTTHSRTPVPQPLEYLVQDSARRHGRVRVGSASAYIRADDESALAELLADKRSAPLRLRRLAPTVLAAQAPPETVLQVLRAIGLSPAAESADGGVLVARRDQVRTGPRARPRPVHPLPPAPAEPALLSAAAALRAADEAAAARALAVPHEPVDVGPAPTLVPMDTAGVLALLRDAASRRVPLWVGYVDSAGNPSNRLVDPLRVEGGRVSAFDRAAEEVRTIAVSRVTGVAAATPP